MNVMGSREMGGWEIFGEEINGDHGLPPGFRFHPTDEELVTFYLASKVFNGSLCGVDIVEVDLNRCEPWELPEGAKMGEREWYFYSLKDRKYPTGLRTNRATNAGYWKATGKDREVHASATGALVGMKKTLVFYKGRAPRGEKTRWVLHEYRLHGDFSFRQACKEEWVICRIFHKGGGGGGGGGGELLKKSAISTTATATATVNFPSSSSYFQALDYPPFSALNYSCFSPLLEYPQTLENPFSSLLKPTTLPGKEQIMSAPAQEELLSNYWIESSLQDPSYDTHIGLIPIIQVGVPPVLLHDMPFVGPHSFLQSGPFDA